MLANVVEGKGLLPLLRALSVQLQEHDPLALDVVGSLDAEPAYVDACRELMAAHPRVQQRVHLLGAQAHERALEHLSRAQVLVSASHMESYGMALAEARAAGVPIIAMDGGNAFSHVEPAAGGARCISRQEVAAELLRLARDPAWLAERDRLARTAIRARSWDDAAAELIAAASAAA
jgi:glycosyltransferase involved in cell wall biosynthesis